MKTHWVAGLVVTCAMAPVAAWAQQAPPPQQIGTKWTDEQLFKAVADEKVTRDAILTRSCFSEPGMHSQ